MSKSDFVPGPSSSHTKEEQDFIHPLRHTYRHVGRPIPPNLRELTKEEKELYPLEDYGYVRFEEYGPEKAPAKGSFWNQAKLDRVHSGCGGVSTMSNELAQSFAQGKISYRYVYCSHCQKSFKVGADGEFVWYGTTDRLGDI